MHSIFKDWRKTKVKIEFESRAKVHSNAVQNSLKEYLGISSFIKDFLIHSQKVTRNEFSLYANSALARYPGVQALSWNPLVRDQMRSVYESEARADGFKDFTFTDRSNTGKLVQAEKRDEYIVVYFIEPLEKNRSALGFDISSNLVRRQAIEIAFDTGKPAATDRIKLVQEAGNQFGTLILNPIYQKNAPINTIEDRRKNRKGLVVEALRIGDAIDAALGDFAGKDLHLYLYDITYQNENKLLYACHLLGSEIFKASADTAAQENGVHLTTDFDFAGRRWKLILVPSLLYLEAQKNWTNGLVLSVGLFLTVLLVIYLFNRLKYIDEIEIRIHREADANKQLADSERLHRATIENISDAIFITDDEGSFTYICPNPQFIFGVTSEELAALGNIQSLFGDTIFELAELDEKKEIPNIELAIIDRYKQEHFLFVNVKQVSIRAGTILYTCRDITERKQAEASLRESEERWRSLTNNTKDIIQILDTEGHILYMNKGYLPHTIKDVISKSVLNFTVDEFKESTQKSINRLLTGEGPQTFETAIHISDDTINPFEVTFVPILVDDKVNKIISIVTDISERKKNEAEHERLMSAIEQVGEMVVITDIDGIIQYVNPAFIDTTGYSKQESIGQNPRFLNSGKHDRSFYKSLWDTILSGNQWIGRLVNRRKDGSLYTAECSISPVKNEQNVIQNFVWISSDITEKIELEAIIQHGQQLESIGNLAGGIAHDFNNILSSIIGFTELALDDAEIGTNIEDNLQEIYAAGKRAKNLVSQILAFARQSEKEIKPIQVDTVVEEVLQFIRSSIPTSIEIRKNIDSDSLIMGNSTQVHQIMMNLSTNAAHAMEDKGGILEVSLQDILINKGREKNLLGLKPGDYIEIKVSDTGVGIPPDILSSIFKPYFTTKDPGEGTGMGLAMVHGIVESYDGKITVDSKLGEGSVFKIHLPVTRKRRDHHSCESKELPSGTERILFVDDEAPIAKMGSQGLERLGYQVTTRTSSIEALELFRSKPDDFDLIITDMTMPNMAGDKLAIELMKIMPDIPVILCTGYSKKISDDSASDIGIKAFAYKPIVRADLAKTVRKVLDEAKSKS